MVWKVSEYLLPRPLRRFPDKMAGSALSPIQSSGLNKKYLRLEHTRPRYYDSDFHAAAFDIFHGRFCFISPWPTARFPFEYRPSLWPDLGRKLRTAWRFDSPRKWRTRSRWKSKETRQDVTTMAADTINLYGL